MSCKATDLTGQRYGRLTVLRRGTLPNANEACWYCKCDCGNRVTVRSTNLRRNSRATRSCGCLLRETRRAVAEQNFNGVRRDGRLAPGQFWFVHALLRHLARTSPRYLSKFSKADIARSERPSSRGGSKRAPR